LDLIAISGPVVAIPIAAIGQYCIGIFRRVVYEPFLASPVCGVGGVTGAFVFRDIREDAQRPRESNAAGRIVVYEFRCDYLIRGITELYPMDQSLENVVLRVGGPRQSALTEGIGAGPAGAMAHPGSHE
jgi:hypothetical protein